VTKLTSADIIISFTGKQSSRFTIWQIPTSNMWH